MLGLLWYDAIVCKTCKAGYTFSADKNKFTPGCPIENCQFCIIYFGDYNTYCHQCNNGYIGMFYQPVYDRLIV